MEILDSEASAALAAKPKAISKPAASHTLPVELQRMGAVIEDMTDTDLDLYIKETTAAAKETGAKASDAKKLVRSRKTARRTAEKKAIREAKEAEQLAKAIRESEAVEVDRKARLLTEASEANREARLLATADTEPELSEASDDDPDPVGADRFATGHALHSGQPSQVVIITPQQLAASGMALESAPATPTPDSAPAATPAATDPSSKPAYTAAELSLLAAS
jgi:hypothetical protein